MREIEELKVMEYGENELSYLKKVKDEIKNKIEAREQNIEFKKEKKELLRLFEKLTAQEKKELEINLSIERVKYVNKLKAEKAFLEHSIKVFEPETLEINGTYNNLENIIYKLKKMNISE